VTFCLAPNLGSGTQRFLVPWAYHTKLRQAWMQIDHQPVEAQQNKKGLATRVQLCCASTDLRSNYIPVHAWGTLVVRLMLCPAVPLQIDGVVPSLSTLGAPYEGHPRSTNTFVQGGVLMKRCAPEGVAVFLVKDRCNHCGPVMHDGMS
jgi:hypothetical protein